MEIFTMRWCERSYWSVGLFQAERALCAGYWHHVAQFLFLFPIWLKVGKSGIAFNFLQIFEHLQVSVKQMDILNFFLIFAQRSLLLHRWSHNVSQVVRTRNWKFFSVINRDKSTDHAKVSRLFCPIALHCLKSLCTQPRVIDALQLFQKVLGATVALLHCF